MKDNTNSAKVLIVAPSRELALQITNQLHNFSPVLNLQLVEHPNMKSITHIHKTMN